MELALDRSRARQQVCRYFHLDKTKPIVAWMPTRNCAKLPERDYQLEDVLLTLRACSDFQVVLAGHDLDQPTVPEFLKADWLKEPEIKMKLLTAADCVLTDGSSIAFEALVVGARPVVLMTNFSVPNYMRLEHDAAQPVVDFGTWTRPEIVVESIQEALANPLALQERRLWWRDQVVGPVDGKCVQRIVEEIERAGA